MQQTGQQQRQQRYTGGKQRTHLQKDGSAHYTECGAAQLCAPGGCSLAGGAARAGDLQRQRGPKADGRAFAKAFRKKYGVRPSDFRKMRKQESEDEKL